MSNIPGSNTSNSDFISPHDPTVTATYGSKGSLLRYANEIGVSKLFIKQDEGITTNWALVGPGGSAPLGDPNTLAFFDGGGNLDSETKFSLEEVNAQFAFGNRLAGGLITAGGNSTLAFGIVNAGTLNSSGQGSIAFGTASVAGALVTSTGIGSFAMGSTLGLAASGFVAQIRAVNSGAVAMGRAAVQGPIGAGSAIMESLGQGSFTLGYVESGATMRSNGFGSFVMGASDGQGFAAPLMLADHNGCFALGIATNVNGGTTASLVQAGDSGVGNARACFVMGHAAGGGIVRAIGKSSFAFGGADTLSLGAATCTVEATGQSAFAFGRVTSPNSTINASGTSSYAGGNAATAGVINSAGIASFAFGRVADLGSNILSISSGSFAAGFADAAGDVLASGAGSVALGRSTGAAATIASGGLGSLASGFVDTGVMLITGSGSVVHGSVVTSSNITNVGNGSFAVGRLEATSLITLSGNGSLALGSLVAGSTLTVSGDGSLGGGRLEAASTMTVSGNGSLAWGISHTVSSDYSLTVGQTNINSSFACIIGGRFANGAGFTPASWVDTDPMFLLGNGTGVGTEANGFRVDKDARVTTTSSQVNAGNRVVSGGAVVASARTDNMLLADTSLAPVVVNLPAGEDGLEFIIKDGQFNAAANPITINASVGQVETNAGFAASDTIVTNGGMRWYRFFGSIWYLIARLD